MIFIFLYDYIMMIEIIGIMVTQYQRLRNAYVVICRLMCSKKSLFEVHFHITEAYNDDNRCRNVKCNDVMTIVMVIINYYIILTMII